MLLHSGMVIELPLHNIVAPHNDLSACFSIPGNIVHVIVDCPDRSILAIGNTLMSLELGALGYGKFIPLSGMPFLKSMRSISFSKAIALMDIQPDILTVLNNFRLRRDIGNVIENGMIKSRIIFCHVINDYVHCRRCSAHSHNIFSGRQLVDFVTHYGIKVNMLGTDRGYLPYIIPAMTMKHG
jgi:hypothetical protein